MTTLLSIIGLLALVLSVSIHNWRPQVTEPSRTPKPLARTIVNDPPAVAAGLYRQQVQPSVAIDLASLSSTSSQPTIAGTASGVNSISVIVRVPSAKFSGWAEIGAADNVPVSNGRWFIRLSDSVIPPTDDFPNGLHPGTYLIDAIADVDHQDTGTMTISR